MVHVDLAHSNLYPYAMRLAKECGAVEVFVEPKLGGIIEPDVLGVRDSDLITHASGSFLSADVPGQDSRKPLIIVQCEVSTGPKTQRHRFEKHSEANQVADFVYILDGAANQPHVRRNILSAMPDAEVHTLEELKEEFGDLTVDSTSA